MKTSIAFLAALLLAPLAALHAADVRPAANPLSNSSFEEKEGDGVRG